MKRLLLSLLAVCALGFALLLPATADNHQVDAVVTPLVLAVNVSPTSIDYGALALSTDDNTRTQAVSETITATNAGSVNADLNIRGSDAVDPNAVDPAWTLDCSDATRGVVGANQFAHRFKVLPFDDATAQALCSDSDNTLAPGVAPEGTTQFALQMNMPTDTTGFSQRSTTVTIVATEAP